MLAVVRLNPAVFRLSLAPIPARLLLLRSRLRVFSPFTQATAVATEVVVSPMPVMSVPLK